MLDELHSPQQVFHIFLAILERASLKIFSSWKVSGLLSNIRLFLKKTYSLCQIAVYFLAAILSHPLIIHTAYDILYRIYLKKEHFEYFLWVLHYWRINGEFYILTAASLRLAGHDSVNELWPFTVPNPDEPMNLPSEFTQWI